MPSVDFERLRPEQMQALIGYPRNFARVAEIGDGRATLEYVLDPALWPWLGLPGWHPVLIEKYQYFSVVTGLLALGMMTPGQPSALTAIEWSCPSLTDAAPARGVVKADPDALQFTLELVDDDGDTAFTVRGEGTSFDAGEFRARRQHAKTAAEADTDAIDFAAPQAAGLASDFLMFLGQAEARDGASVARGRVDTTRAFHPGHPFHTGTGDHVNAGHLLDCALQLAQLVAGRPLRCHAGAARFLRFVELNRNFEIEARGDIADMHFTLSQSGRISAEMQLALSD